MQNIRTYKKLIRELTAGQTFYYNSIAGTSAMIDYTRELIKAGVITPLQSELDKMIKPEAQYKFITGECIAPQMTYIKLLEV